MSDNAADFGLHLRDTGRINIELDMENPSTIECRITELQPSSDVGGGG